MNPLKNNPLKNTYDHIPPMTEKRPTTLVIKYTNEEYEHDGYCSDYDEESVTLTNCSDKISCSIADFNDVFRNKKPITNDTIEEIS